MTLYELNSSLQSIVSLNGEPNIYLVIQNVVYFEDPLNASANCLLIGIQIVMGVYSCTLNLAEKFAKHREVWSKRVI